MTFNQLIQRPDCKADALCAELARMFRVRMDEIAIMQAHGRHLRFLWPAQLRGSGAIPLSSSAVAARTANTRHPELFNDFAQVQHFSIFEVMASTRKATALGDSHVIQKLMSAPIIDGQEKLWGVIQVSRKGSTRDAAGPDFTLTDLEQLMSVAGAVATRIPDFS